MAVTTDGIDITIIDAFLEMLWERGGTDLLVTAGSPLRLRVDGALAVIPGQPALTEAQASELVVRIIGQRSDRAAARAQGGRLLVPVGRPSPLPRATPSTSRVGTRCRCA